MTEGRGQFVSPGPGRRYPQAAVIQSVPGIGIALGARILGEVGDAGRFPAVRGLCAYACFVPVAWVGSGTSPTTASPTTPCGRRRSALRRSPRARRPTTGRGANANAGGAGHHHRRLRPDTLQSLDRNIFTEWHSRYGAADSSCTGTSTGASG
ncbi:transposase [Streptomyces sp. NPDC058603]|uniref:transposase n=1 Tax=Streptomyces sp. NPDC058603 TaxID=3346551 RepID=UPI003661B716